MDFVIPRGCADPTKSGDKSEIHRSSQYFLGNIFLGNIPNDILESGQAFPPLFAVGHEPVDGVRGRRPQHPRQLRHLPQGVAQGDQQPHGIADSLHEHTTRAAMLTVVVVVTVMVVVMVMLMVVVMVTLWWW